MTLCEKIIAAHAIVDAKTGTLGVTAVKPGDALFVRTDVRFSSRVRDADGRCALPRRLRRGREGHRAGERLRVPRPPDVPRPGDARRRTARWASTQQAASSPRCRTASPSGTASSSTARCSATGRPSAREAICHNKVIEELALPGQLVAGTDSHTCMAGALGCFAFGVGSTDMANAWFTRTCA